MVVPTRRKEVDLSVMGLDDLRALISKIERELSVRQFEEGLRHALSDYQRRDPHVIRI